MQDKDTQHDGVVAGEDINHTVVTGDGMKTMVQGGQVSFHILTTIVYQVFL